MTGFNLCYGTKWSADISCGARGVARFIGLCRSLHRSRAQMTFVSHQMLRGRCHSIYCHDDLLVSNDHSHGEEHVKKGQTPVEGSCRATFIPVLSGLHIVLLVIVWPSAVFPASLTTLLSKRGVCAKHHHLPFAPLIQPRLCTFSHIYLTTITPVFICACFHLKTFWWCYHRLFIYHNLNPKESDTIIM